MQEWLDDTASIREAFAEQVAEEFWGGKLRRRKALETIATILSHLAGHPDNDSYLAHTLLHAFNHVNRAVSYLEGGKDG